jgi:cytochrome b561
MIGKLHKILLWVTIISLIFIILSTIPLLISYLKGVDIKFPFITIIHVWSGVLLIIVVLIRAFMNRKRLKIMLTK